MHFLLLAGAVAFGIFAFSGATEDARCRIGFNCNSSETRVDDRTTPERPRSEVNPRRRSNPRPERRRERTNRGQRNSEGEFITSHPELPALERISNRLDLRLIISREGTVRRRRSDNPLGLQPAPRSRINYSKLELDQRTIRKLQDVLAVLEPEFNKYPNNFFNEAEIRDIVFVRNLRLGNSARNMIPDHTTRRNRVLIDIDMALNLYQNSNRSAWYVYVSHIIHHEIFHILDHEFNRRYRRNNPWRELNHSYSVYREDDHDGYEEDEYNTSLDTSFRRFSERRGGIGFISNYARVNPIEDRADIFGYYMTEGYGSSNRFQGMRRSDPIINAKVTEMERFLDDNFPSWARRGENLLMI